MYRGVIRKRSCQKRLLEVEFCEENIFMCMNAWMKMVEEITILDLKYKLCNMLRLHVNLPILMQDYSVGDDKCMEASCIDQEKKER